MHRGMLDRLAEMETTGAPGEQIAKQKSLISETARKATNLSDNNTAKENTTTVTRLSAEAVDTTDRKAFFKSIRSILSETDQGFPNMIRDAEGKEHSTKQGILTAATEHLQRVASLEDEDAVLSRKNRPKDAQDKLKQHQNTAKSKVTDADSKPPQLSDKTGRISLTAFADAVKSRKKSSQVGPTAEGYEHLLHGGTIIAIISTQIMNLFMTLAYVPPMLLQSTVKLLYKRKGSRLALSQYRPISLSSCFLKTYERILERRLNKIVIGKKMLHRAQAACKPGLGATDAVADLLDDLHDADGYVAVSIDLSKAFDRVNYDMLFARLLQIGIEGKLWHAIRATYDGHKSIVAIGNHKSRTFELAAGVKQGSVLSPLLFVLYVNTLLESLEKTGAGVRCPRTKAINFGKMYVDDLILVAETDNGIQKLYNTVRQFCTQWNMVMNSAKTVVTHANSAETANWFIAANNIPETGLQQNVKYVGIHIQFPCKSKDWTTHVTARAKSHRKIFHLMQQVGIAFRGGHIPAMMKAVDRILAPTLEYGGEIVEMSRPVATIYNKQIAFVLRKIMGMHPHTPTMWVIREAGMLFTEEALGKSLLRLWRKRIAEVQQETAERSRKGGAIDSIGLALATDWNLHEEGDMRYITIAKGVTGAPTKLAWKKTITEAAQAKSTERFHDWVATKPEIDAARYTGMAAHPIGLNGWEWTTKLTPTEVINIFRIRSGWGSFTSRDKGFCPMCATEQHQSEDSAEHSMFECEYPPFLNCRSELEQALKQFGFDIPTQWQCLQDWDTIGQIYTEATLETSQVGIAVRKLLALITTIRKFDLYSY